MTDKPDDYDGPRGTLVPTKSGLRQLIVRYKDGKTRKRLKPFPRGMSDAMVEERRRFYAEQYAKLDPPTKTRGDGTETAGDKWWAEFFAFRESKGLTPVGSLYHAHLKPALAGKHPRDWTPADCEAVRDALDAKIAAGYWDRPLPNGETRRYRFGWKRAWNIWALFTSACKAAKRSKNKALRVRTDNPCADIEPPDRGRHKRKQWLWPNEFLRLAACRDVPWRWRVLYTLLVYSYLRPNELAALLAHTDVDLQIFHLNVTKAWDFQKREPKDHPKTSAGVRRVPIEAPLAPLLEALVAARKAGDRLLESLPPPEDWAATFREHLQRAGVTRPELFEDTATSKQVTLYDLRGSGITWRTLRRDDTREIQRAAGHEKYSTTELYVREAMLFLDRDIGTPFPPLPPELFEGFGSPSWITHPQEKANMAKELVKLGVPKGIRTSSRAEDHEGSHGFAQGEGSETQPTTPPNPAIPGERSKPLDHPTLSSDPVEGALADALTKAAIAGQWSAVEVLTRELEARRKARAGVVELDAERAKRGRS